VKIFNKILTFREYGVGVVGFQGVL